MGAVAADVMLIFGDVGEVREIAVGAHDRQCLVGAEAVERRLELAPRADLVVAVEADRGLANLLDQLEDLFALLLAHRVAEDVGRAGGCRREAAGPCPPHPWPTALRFQSEH